jgi:hypothetical protein
MFSPPIQAHRFPSEVQEKLPLIREPTNGPARD